MDDHELPQTISLPGPRRPDSGRSCPTCGRWLRQQRGRWRRVARVAAAFRERESLLRLHEGLTLSFLWVLNLMPFAVALVLLTSGHWLGALLLAVGGSISLAFVSTLIELDESSS